MQVLLYRDGGGFRPRKNPDVRWLRFTKELAADGSHYKVEEIYRDVKITEIYEGANEIQKYLVARKIFGRNFVG